MIVESVVDGTELRFGKLFAATWQLYRKYFVPVTVLAVFSVLPDWFGFFQDTGDEFDFARFSMEFLLAIIITVFPFMAVAVIAAEGAEGRYPCFADTVRRTLSVLPRAFITYLLMMLFLAGWLLLLIIPGVIKMVRYSFVFQAVILRSAGYMEAFRYSQRLVKDYWWVTVFATVMVFLPGISVELLFWGANGFSFQSTPGLSPIEAIIKVLTNGFFFVGDTLLFLALERIKDNHSAGDAVAESVNEI